VNIEPRRFLWALTILAALGGSIPAHAAILQQQTPADSTKADSTAKPIILTPLNVTATRTPTDIFETAAPVAVIDSSLIRSMSPNTAIDMFRKMPGLDVNGVGTNQTRPIIRGQRGQRVLLLGDGLRLNNPRRQSDFGEIPAIVDVNDLSRIEVVRGPASVLYGSDAIGGVVNMISDVAPPLAGGDTFGGTVRYIYRSEGEQSRPNGNVYGRTGKFGFRASAAFRNAQAYSAPAGTFGDYTLTSDATVNDTGVEDQNYSVLLDYSFTPQISVFGKVDIYRAKDAGFGFVSNEDLGAEGDPTIRITYPDQDVDRYTLGYRSKDLGWAFADRLEFTTYYMENQRSLNLDIFIPFGPGMGLAAVNDNFTDISTLGFRLESAKLLGNVLLTYGADYSHNDSKNTDQSVTTLVGMGPPSPDVSDTPQVPNALYDQLGVFAQGDLKIGQKVSLILGGRYQNVTAETRPTPGLPDLPVEFNDGTFVGAANLLVDVTRELNLAFTVGRGFRAPNIIEMFFRGPTPEGSGFQIPNPNLKSETSLNLDLGVKYKRQWVAFEAFLWQNEISDGITIVATGDTIGGFPVFQDQNIDKLRYRGFETLVELLPVQWLGVGATFSLLDSKDANNPANPIGDSYGTKFSANVTYRHPSQRFWTSYSWRWSGPQRNGAETLQDLPAFNVSDLRAGVQLFTSGRMGSYLNLAIENVFNELYAEYSNASFFRPQPKRTVLASVGFSF
jgi:outer membrane receptor protein involved in Fe transport